MRVAVVVAAAAAAAVAFEERPHVVAVVVLADACSPPASYSTWWMVVVLPHTDWPVLAPHSRTARSHRTEPKKAPHHTGATTSPGREGGGGRETLGKKIFTPQVHRCRTVPQW